MGRRFVGVYLDGVHQRFRTEKLLNQPVDNLRARHKLNHMVLDRSPTLDRVFHALSHPARRAILRQLTVGERNLSELADPLKMSFPAASKHVKVLERAKLVRRRVVGRTHIFRVEDKPMAEANQWLEEYRRNWERNFLRLDALLDQMKAEERDRQTGQRKR
jgi:DNA-binding transcriptional ArsR family regulator